MHERIGVDQLDRARRAQRRRARRRAPLRRRPARAAAAGACRRRGRRSASRRRGRPGRRPERSARAPIRRHRARRATRCRRSSPLHRRGPRPQLALLQHLDLLLDGLEPRPAVLQQLGAALVAREQALERQLAAFHGGDQRLELAQRHFVARRRRGRVAGIGRSIGSLNKSSIVVSRTHLRLTGRAGPPARPRRAASGGGADGRLPGAPLGTIRDPLAAHAAAARFAAVRAPRRCHRSMEVIPVMSDLSVTREALEPAQSPVSVSSYFDPALFRREQELALRTRPRYLGHELAVPEIGDYYALPQEAEGRALVRTPGGLELLSNVCRHRQAVMLRGRGKTGTNIVCPLHRWTYDLGGQLLGAPHFADDPCRDLAELSARRPGTACVFDTPASARARRRSATWRAIGPSRELDFAGYVLDSVHVHECDYNWKTFIEVYLEDYHVGPFHPGLGQLRHLRRPALGVRRRTTRCRPSAPKNEPGQARVARLPQVARRRARLPRRALRRRAAPRRDLAHLLPDDHGRVVSARAGRLDAVPKGPQKTLNIVEFYYPEEIARVRARVRRGRAGGLLGDLRRGRRDRAAHGRRPARPATSAATTRPGPYQSPMEDGMQHFHEWYRRRCAERVAADAAMTSPAWLIVCASFLFATMGVCVKLASAQYSAPARSSSTAASSAP